MYVYTESDRYTTAGNKLLPACTIQMVHNTGKNEQKLVQSEKEKVEQWGEKRGQGFQISELEFQISELEMLQVN